MDYLNIPCIVTTGIATNNVGITKRYGWSSDYVEHVYYQIDITWDLLEGQHDRVIKCDYFNLTAADIYRTRVADYECQYVQK